jgi:hypothetical protein
MSRAARGNPKAFINSLGLTPFQRRPGEKDMVGVRLVDLRQSKEGEMNLRQRFVARAPIFAGAADLFDNMWRERRGKGGRQQRKEARLFAIESETARRAAFLFEFREQGAAPSTRPAWVNVISR